MLTNPNTLGLFERQIVEIAERRARRRRPALLRRRQPQRAARAAPGPATWASTWCTSTCTRPSPRPTAAAGRAPGRSACDARPGRAVPARAASSSATDGAFRLETDRDRPRVIGRMHSLPRQLRRAGPRLRLHPARTAPTGSRRVSENAVLNANYLHARPVRTPTPCPSTPRTACTSSWLSARAPRPRHGRAHARHRQAAHRPRLPPADDLLPADRARGADDRADRDREHARRSTRSPTRCSRSPARPARPPDLVKEAPHATPVRRLDEATAARQPVLRWRGEPAAG